MVELDDTGPDAGAGVWLVVLEVGAPYSGSDPALFSSSPILQELLVQDLQESKQVI